MQCDLGKSSLDAGVLTADMAVTTMTEEDVGGGAAAVNEAEERSEVERWQAVRGKEKEE